MERQRSDDDSGVGSKEGAEGGRIRRWGHIGAEEGKIEIKGGFRMSQGDQEARAWKRREREKEGKIDRDRN